MNLIFLGIPGEDALRGPTRLLTILCASRWRLNRIGGCAGMSPMSSDKVRIAQRVATNIAKLPDLLRRASSK